MSLSIARSLAFAVAVFAAPSFAQIDGGDLPITPRAVNPGDESASLLRESAQLVSAAEPSLDAGVMPVSVTPEVLPAVASADLSASIERPRDAALGLTAALKASVRSSYQGATPFLVDAQQTQLTVAPWLTRVRVSPEVHWARFGLIAEADTATGAVLGTPSAELVGSRVPYPSIAALDLRKLYLEYSWASGAFRVGQQTSNWGLGLLANDGAHDPEAGDFGQQQFGNLTYRGLLAVRPFFSLGGHWRALETAFAADLIVRDNIAELSHGDRAFQGVFALRYVKDEANSVGVYAVYRSQRNINVSDGGKATDVFVVDVAAKWQLIKRHHRALNVGFEAVAINGTTTQARHENAALLGVHQYGAAAKAAYRFRQTTLLLDWGFASGDHNLSDDQVQNFRFDRDFKVGLILFDQVMAYQSARSAIRAADPNLTGRPAEGLDLLGTASSITGAWYLFPRVKHALRAWLDVYTGPLFAFSTAALTDAFNTRISGGTSVNPFGVKAGGYLGTEFDLGLQARFTPVDELLLAVTGEGGMFLPGAAYRLPQGGVMPPVGFGRVRVSLSL